MTVLLKVNIKPFHNIKEQEIFLTCFLYLRHVPGPKQLCVKDLIKTDKVKQSQEVLIHIKKNSTMGFMHSAITHQVILN